MKAARWQATNSSMVIGLLPVSVSTMLVVPAIIPLR
jgi:hypothetical protein